MAVGSASGQIAQSSVTLTAVLCDTVGSPVNWNVRPLQAWPTPSCQHGPAPPVSLHGFTGTSANALLALATCSVTTQSGRLGFFGSAAKRVVRHSGPRTPLIIVAT